MGLYPIGLCSSPRRERLSERCQRREVRGLCQQDMRHPSSTRRAQEKSHAQQRTTPTFARPLAGLWTILVKLGQHWPRWGRLVRIWHTCGSLSNIVACSTGRPIQKCVRLEHICKKATSLSSQTTGASAGARGQLRLRVAGRGPTLHGDSGARSRGVGTRAASSVRRPALGPLRAHNAHSSSSPEIVALHVGAPAKTGARAVWGKSCT